MFLEWPVVAALGFLWGRGGRVGRDFHIVLKASSGKKTKSRPPGGHQWKNEHHWTGGSDCFLLPLA